MAASLEADWAGRPTVQLGFARDGGDPGAPTRLVVRYAAHPFAVQRPLYADPALPGLPQVYLLTTGAGVLGGDDLRLDVQVGPGAHAFVGTVGATRLHPGGAAAQAVHLRLEGDAVLEWMPDPLIPFAGSRFAQAVEVRLGPRAQWLAADVLTAGREAAGERFAFAAVDQRLTVFGLDERRPWAAERYRLEPGSAPLTGPAVMAGYSALGTFRAVSRAVPAARLAAALREAVTGCDGVLGGATTMPGSCGAMARALGPTAEAVGQALHRAWDAARRLCLGVPAPAPRRY